MMKRLIAVLTALMLLLSAAAIAEETADDPVLVTVNGQELRESSEEFRVWQDYLTYEAGADAADYADLIRQYALDYAIRYAAMTQKLNEMGKGVSDEELAAGAEEIRAGWNSIVEQFMAQYYAPAEDATDEEKAAARADTLAYILENFGYTEESYVEESMMYDRLNAIYSRGQEVAAEGIEVSDQEVEDYFKSLVEEDEAFFNDMVQPVEGEEMTAEELKEDLVQAYEFYTKIYGYEYYFRPEGYRGITHILLGVDQELLDNWQDLTARLEEQNDAEGATDVEAENADAGEQEATEEPEEPVTPEMVEAAKQAILDSVKDTLAEINQKLADGANFEDLIPEYSKDHNPEASQVNIYPIHKYSILGYVQPFLDAAAAMENVGEISDPVISQFGVHILHYLNDIPGNSVELTDTLKEELRTTLLDEKIGTAFNELQDKWVEESEIVWTEAGESWKIDEAALAADTEAAEPAEAAE